MPLAHVVVGAFLHGFGAFIDEAHRAVFRVVGDLPDAGGCPDQCLIAVRVVNRLKGGFFSALDGGVLVERAGCVGGRFFRVFPRGFPVADVVVTVAVCPAADGAGFHPCLVAERHRMPGGFPGRCGRRTLDGAGRRRHRHSYVGINETVRRSGMGASRFVLFRSGF